MDMRVAAYCWKDGFSCFTYHVVYLHTGEAPNRQLIHDGISSIFRISGYESIVTILGEKAI